MTTIAGDASRAPETATGNSYWTSKSAEPTTVKSALALAALVLLALTLRTACVVMFSGEIDTEGAEYARIAQNIAAGKGYSGIATEGVQLFFPPLFPFLIVSVAFFTGDAEIAGRTVSVVFGSLLILPVFGIACHIFGKRLALVSALLTAVHPHLIYLSTTVFCETTYVTIVLGGVLALMKAIDHPRKMLFLIAGALYGLAFLIRSEAAAFMVIGVLFLCLHRVLKERLSFKSLALQNAPAAGLLLVSFLVFAGPYIAWLSLRTGEFRLEGKAPLNLSTEMRILGGATNYEATFSVGEDLHPTGSYNQPNIDVIRNFKARFTDYAKIMTSKWKDYSTYASAAITSRLEFGAPVLFVLAFLGLFRSPWNVRTAFHNLHLLSLLALTAIAPLFVYYQSIRFYLLFLVLYQVWAGAGLGAVESWVRMTAKTMASSKHAAIRFGHVAVALAVAAVIGPASIYTASSFRFSQATRAIKSYGVALSRTGTPLKIADTSTPLSFHARARFVWLPFTDAVTARRYLGKEEVTHVVLRKSQVGLAPYLTKWYEFGVPGADLQTAIKLRGGEEVRVYSLSAAPADVQR